jgi:hypothetical protein
MLNHLYSAMMLASLFIYFTFADEQSMKPIFNAYGNETGSFNVNPDPNGEQWIVTPLKMTSERRAMLDALPEWEPRKKTHALPSMVNHFKEPEFRPIFTQKGGSCSAASGTGYVYTWEANILTGALGQTNRCMYFFGYNFLNNGNSENGIWWMDAWDIMKYTGCVREADWPSQLGSEKGTEWAATYAAYHNANFDRCSTYFKITNPGSSAGLVKVKQWIHDHGRGDAKGGCLEFNAYHEFSTTTAASGSSVPGEKIATTFDGTKTTHAMMFAGYDDNVYSSSSATKGALLLVNSWGTTWMNKGTLWIPYDKFASETEVYCLEVVKHVPRLEFKVSLQGYGKSGGSFTSGFTNNISATSPTTTQIYGNAFSKNSGTFTGEIGLDITKAWSSFSGNNSTGKFFLQSKGTGTISSLSLMIYDETGANLLNEIKCAQKNVTIGTTMSIVVENAVGVADPLLALPTKALTIRQSAGRYSLYLPFSGNSAISLKDIRGRELASFVSNCRNWYFLPVAISPGVYIITVNNNGKEYVERLNSAR